MAVKNQLKCKRVAFQNKLIEGQPTQYKLAMVTPIVVTKEKFVENVTNHTGLNRTIVRSVIDAIEECAGDYMELGNAVQLGSDFGTLKPSIRVKAVDSPEKCTADTVLGIGTKFIPTGNMRSRLASVGFVVKGTSSGDDVDEPDVEPESQNPGESGDSGEAETVKYTMTFKFNDGSTQTAEYAAGASISYPSNTSGYQWPASKPSVMPAQNTSVTEVAVSGGGDDDENDI